MFFLWRQNFLGNIIISFCKFSSQTRSKSRNLYFPYLRIQFWNSMDDFKNLFLYHNLMTINCALDKIGHLVTDKKRAPTGLLGSSRFPKYTYLFSYLSIIYSRKQLTEQWTHHTNKNSHSIFIVILNTCYHVKYGVRSSKFIWAPVYSCSHSLRPRNSLPPPPPAFGLIYEGAIGYPR